MRFTVVQQGLCLGLALAVLVLRTALSEGIDVQDLPGWQGETYTPSEQARENGLLEPWVETISWMPRAFLHHNFLTHLECGHMVALGNKRVERSMVADDTTGKPVESTWRTSYGGWFQRGEDPVISAIEERIAEWTHLPSENQEGLQILRYTDGQKYGIHLDKIYDPTNSEAGPRYATVLMYLADVEEGGETIFPQGRPISGQAPLDNPSECTAGMPMVVKPRKGDALLFFYTDMDGQERAQAALHASCPTLKGTKWTATKWIHSKAYQGGYNALENAGKCFDIAQNCLAKESQGLCDTDHSLVGLAGSCRLTCGDCIQCPQDDIMCYRSNMKGRRQHMTPGAGGNGRATAYNSPGSTARVEAHFGVQAQTDL